MKRFASMILMAAIFVSMGLAQETSGAGDQGKAAASQPHRSGMNVEDHLKLLSEKLNLSTDQQAKVRPILQDWHDSSEKIKQDESLSQEERTAKLHAEMMKADKGVREVLTDEQKKKLDELEQEHFGPHHNTTGSSSSH